MCIRDRDYVESISPLGAYKAAVYTIDRFNLHGEKPEELVREWFDMAKEEYAKKVVCKPGAKEYITHLFKGGKKLAVATSSDRELFMPTLEREGILNCFSEIVTVDEVKRGKGFPEMCIRDRSRTVRLLRYNDLRIGCIRVVRRCALKNK